MDTNSASNLSKDEPPEIIDENSLLVTQEKGIQSGMASHDYINNKLSRISRWLPFHMIGRLWSRIRNRDSWQYDCAWEHDNEERYKTGDLDEEETFIIEQKFLPAKEIVMDLFTIDETGFPWHGHSFDDFIQLNSQLQECIGIVQKIQNPKEVKRFRDEHRTVYDAYFETPIHVLKGDDNRYYFGGDGRHRVYVASLHNDLLPVWILEYRDPKSVSCDYYIKNVASGTWRFLDEV